MLPRLAILLLAAPLVAAEPPAGLQGGWKLVAVETDAGPADLPEIKPALVIKGDKVLHGGQEIARLTADPAADPKVIDLKFDKPERTYEGVYSLGKDTLKVCVNGRSEGVKERPSGFTVDGHPGWRQLTFERVKPEDATPGSGFVGLVLMFDEPNKQVVVQSTVGGSPAKAAGFQKGDVVLRIGGAAVETLRGAVDSVRAAKPGTELVLKVRRADKEVDVKVKATFIPFAALAGLE
jgi:uncharacterized protein (TIGR03067 family)